MNDKLQTVTEKQVSKLDAFGSSDMFRDAQRMGMMLCSSSMVPDNYRGEQNLGNCVIALEMASRIGANVMSVMQNLYIVHGKPAWSSQFLISCVNASGRFTPLRYMMTGEKGTDSYGCIAWAIDRSGERLESPEITVGIAKMEGWFGKNGSKWKTMPDLMLRYRSATLFARLYAPELTMGIRYDDEIIDITPTAPIVTDPVKVAKVSRKPVVIDDDDQVPGAEYPAQEAPQMAPQQSAGPATMSQSQSMLKEACEANGAEFSRVMSVLFAEKADTICDWSEVPEAVAASLVKDARALMSAIKKAKA